MQLLPRDRDKLLLHQAGFLAQKRLARGLRLNRPEAVALIASVLQERMRDGDFSVPRLVQHGKEILGKTHVLPGVASTIREIQVEGTLIDGVFLVVVLDPICTDMGNIDNALYGSFLPRPQDSSFCLDHEDQQPGAVIVGKDPKRIEINKGRERLRIRVNNTGDRPIVVGSHYHFKDTNSYLHFDRDKACGMRLDIPAGTATRFEPGDILTVSLCSRKPAEDNCDLSNDNCPTIGREDYRTMYGPTTGDRVRLGDTSLWVKVEWDATALAGAYGDELTFGPGKTTREGMGQASGRSSKDALDLVIINALVIDWSGIYKADIGIKNGHIHGIGKAGNPDIMNADEKLIVGSSTEVIAAENMIVTAGAIDTHVHYVCPQQVDEALASGITTMIGGGTGPATGTKATTCTSSPFYIEHMLRATDGLPMNFGFTGKGSDTVQAKGDSKSHPAALEEVIKSGAAGLKVHEDWGAAPEVIESALDVAKKYDVQVTIHTDTLNESGFVQTTIDAFHDRTIHTYHTEGAGGGHAPDIIVVCGKENVLPSSTNPTRPYAMNTVEEHIDMVISAHNLKRDNPEDIKFAESRIRKETIAAEDILHDMGALSMISSDSQAMGRVGEVISRTWRTASKMRDHRGPLKGDNNDSDNERVKRYIAKYTINPAITHGIGHIVGQIEVGYLADLTLWTPDNFGSKPSMIIKSGVIVCSQMGDPNASISTVEPIYARPMWGAYPASATLNSISFVSKVAKDKVAKDYGLKKKVKAVKNCCNVRKKDMKLNNVTPAMRVDPETYEVTADGELLEVSAAERVPLGRLYNLF